MIVQFSSAIILYCSIGTVFLYTVFSGQSISNVSIRDVPATQLSMSFFDRLTSSGELELVNRLSLQYN